MKKKTIFIQDFGSTSDQMLVCVGVEKIDVLKYCKKVGVKKDFLKMVEYLDWEWMRKQKGVFHWNDESSGTILFLHTPRDEWEYWECLIHELHHAVHEWGKRKCRNEEMEMLAYQQEYLFRSIRRKLMGLPDERKWQ